MKVFYQIKRSGNRFSILIWGMVILSVFAVFSCGRADLNLPVSKDGSVPQKVTVTNIENISGGAIITYQMPKDNNVSYVEAVYEIDGVETRRKGSFYTNNISLDGFPVSKEYKVQLFSVSASEVRSEPVDVTIVPDTPPFLLVAQTLDVQPMFGGVKSIFRNPTKANLRITILAKEDAGWREIQTLYTSVDSGAVYVRGLESREYTFGVVCRDRWQNTSDTLTVKATPLFEEMADYTKFVNYPLPTDVSYELPLVGERTYHTGAPGAGDPPAMWNGEFKAPFTKTPYFYFQNIKTGFFFSGLPSSITVDLGQKYMLSRLVYWPRSGQNAVTYAQLYAATHVRTFELWGSNNPSPDGSYASWTKIGSFESFRPSGNTTPGNENSTEEDRRTAVNGENYDMPEDNQPYRYIRYKVFSTWGAQPYWSCSELQFFGQKVD